MLLRKVRRLTSLQPGMTADEFFEYEFKYAGTNVSVYSVDKPAPQTPCEHLKMLHHSPVPEVRAAKASWVTVTQRRIVIRMPLRQAKGEARFVLDRKAAAATLRRLWKKHGTMIVGALMGYVKP